jgi:hypothetical protein
MTSDYEILKDPIHGYIQILAHEKKIIDSAIFQRLRRVKQNTGVHYAYPGATHSRFSHSLGVMHIAGIFAENLLECIPQVSYSKKKKYYYLMRLWGLTHDIGQGPFSHTFDEVVFGPKYNTDHERFGARILRESSQLPRVITPETGIEIDMDEVASLFEAKSVEEWPLRKRIGKSDVKETMFYYICRGAYSADIIDFLLRDSYFTGAGYGNIDWKRLVFASIPTKDKIVLDPRGEEAFDSLLLARLFMFSTVYYHRTTRAAIRVITQFLNDAASKLEYFKEYIDDVDNFKDLDEDSLLFHPSLADSVYRKQLVDRRIPYSKFEEQRREIDLGISDKALSDFLTQETRNRLPSELQGLPEEAFFVDTPTVRLNPLFGEEEDYIFILDSKQREGFRPRRVLETTWGVLQKKVLLMRLYIHDRYSENEHQIVQAFTRRQAGTHV